MRITRRRMLGLFSGAAAAIGVPSVWNYSMKTYDGPASDHFDGTQFFDPDGVPPKSLRELLRWQFGSDRLRRAWPEWAPSPHADTPPIALRASPIPVAPYEVPAAAPQPYRE